MSEILTIKPFEDADREMRVEGNVRPDAAYHGFIHENEWARNDIIIVGYGSVGSAIGYILEAAGLPYTSIDPDDWEPRNRFNSPAYGWKWSTSQRVGAQKADWKERIEQTPPDVSEINNLLVITATDSIESREFCFKNMNPGAGFVDCRVGAGTLTVVTGDRDWMLEHLPSPSSVEELSCSERGTMEHTFTVAGLGAKASIRALDNYMKEEEVLETFTQLGFEKPPFYGVTFSNQEKVAQG